MQYLTATQAHQMNRVFNAPDTPASVTKVINAGLRLWRERPADVDTLKVFERYDDSNGIVAALYRPFSQADWTAAWNKETGYPPLLRGHTYRVYIQYTRFNGQPRRVFRAVKVVDANSTVAVSGIKIGEVEL